MKGILYQVTGSLSFFNVFAKMKLNIFFLFSMLLTVSGCITPDVPYWAVDHFIAVETDGTPLILQPEDDGTFELSTPAIGNNLEFRRHIKSIAKKIKAIKEDKNDDRELLLIIHGGMVSLEASTQELINTLPYILNTKKYYPIFINWETELQKSYGDSLLFIRQGKYSPWAKLTFPFHLAADLGTALIKFPITYGKQFSSTIKWDNVSNRPLPPPLNWEEKAWLDRKDENIRKNRIIPFMMIAFPGVLRIATTPLLETIGDRGFLNMKRRARLLIRRDEDFNAGRHAYTGGLAILMNTLREELFSNYCTCSIDHDEEEKGSNNGRKPHKKSCSNCKKNKCKDQETGCYEGLNITIIAHSMGAIVANQLIRTFPKFRYEKIIYMAAACTINDFKNEALPYIKSHKSSKFYNLCLHPEDDRWESNLWGTVPAGSLLDWIDNYLTPHQTPMDRTLGKWNNIMQALPVIDYLDSDIRDRMLIRGFGRDGKQYPNYHAAFNDLHFPIKFWQEEFWDFTMDPRTKDRWSPHYTR